MHTSKPPARHDLRAERLGLSNVTAVAKGHSWAANAFSAPSEFEDGNSLYEAHAIVEMNGTVQTGTKRRQELQLSGWDRTAGTVTRGTPSWGDITYETGQQILESSLVRELNLAKESRAKYPDNTTLTGFYDGEIARIESELEALGFIETNGSRTSPVQQYVMTLTVNPVHAEAGVIDVRTDQTTGTGTWLSPGDASITIRNSTPAHLRLKGLTIPQVNGGLFINGTTITGASQISTINAASVADDNVYNQKEPTSTLRGNSFAAIPQPAQTPPQISVVNALNVKDTTHSDIRPDDNYPWSNITVLGVDDGGSGIIAPRASLLIDNKPTGNAKGDIIINNEVITATQTILAGGTLFISGVSQYDVEGIPYGAPLPGEGTGWAKATYGPIDTGLGSFAWMVAANQPKTNDARSIEPTVGTGLIADKIYVSAEYLNINGTIQSGYDTYNLTLGSAAETEIATLRATRGTEFYLPGTSNKFFDVYFNPATNTIRIAELYVSGGYIDLEGHILNSGKGKIKLLGGYADFNIQNDTSYHLQIDGIDASKRGAGTLIIKDKAKGSSADPDVTIYKKDSTGLRKIHNDNPPVTLAGDTVTYLPEKDWRYGWTVGFTEKIIKRGTVTSSSWLFIELGSTFDGPWYSQEIQGQPTIQDEAGYYYKSTDPNAITDSDYQTTVSDSSDPNNGEVAYTFAQTKVTEGRVKPEPQITTRSSWYGKKTHTARYTETETVGVERTHTIEVDRPISIEFLGKNKGTVQINSSVNGAEILVAGPIKNPVGRTAISSQGTITTLPVGADSSVKDIGASIGGQELHLSAKTGIGGGALNPLNVRVTNYSAAVPVPIVPTINVNFHQNGSAADTITRTDAGNWSDDGFVPGQTIEIDGVTSGNHGKTFKIAQVTNTVLELDQNFSTVVTEANQDVKISQAFDIPNAATLIEAPAIAAGYLDAQSDSGGIHILQQYGDLRVEQVADKSSGTVSLEAELGITVNAGGTAKGLVQGGSITINANAGGVGNSTSQPIQLESDNAALHAKVNVTATGDVFLREKTGDLRLEKIQTGGNVYVNVISGELIDANGEEKRDERTYDELKGGVWADLALTEETGALDKIEDSKTEVKSFKESEYRAYWNYRNTQTDTKAFTPDTDVDAHNNTISIPGHNFATGDPVRYSPARIARLNVDFTDRGGAPDTITRGSGSWIADGFAVGQTIRVKGSTSSNSGNLYTIGSLTTTVITLAPTDQLVSETQENVTITVETPASDAGISVFVTSGTAAAGFSGTTEGVVSGTADSVTSSMTVLHDAGATFVTDGVQPGDLIYNVTENRTVAVVSVDSETQVTTEDVTDWSTDQYQTTTQTVLRDTNATFVTDGVQPGDLIYNVTEDITVAVISVDSATQLTTEPVTDWSGDQYYPVSQTVLRDPNATFLADGLAAGDLIYNVTEDTTVAVVSVESETQLTTEAVADWSGDQYEANARLDEGGQYFAIFLGVVSGTADSVTSSMNVLHDPGATFVTDGVQPGDLIYNVIEDLTVAVVSVDSETQLTTEPVTNWTNDQYQTTTLNTDKIKLALSAQDARNGVPIDLASSAGVTGSHQIAGRATRVFDISHQVRLTAEEDAFYRNNSYTQSAITTLEHSRTAQYRTLHQTYVDANLDTHLDTHSFNLSVEATVTIDSGTRTITRTDGGNWQLNGFTPGMVLEITAGGSANTTDPIRTYKIDSVTPTVITLTSDGTLTSETDMKLMIEQRYSYTLTPQEDAALVAGFKVWTEEELLYSISAGLLKAVSDTTTTIEDPNIVGTNITLIVADGIGRTGGQVDIDLATLRLPPASGQMTFSGAQITNGPDWAAAGFKVNQQVFVEGSKNNNGPYVIEAVNGTTLTLDETDASNAAFTSETANVTVSITMTDDERVTLAAAERNDVVYLANDPLVSTVNFTSNTISWVSGSKFNSLTPGSVIQIKSSTSANASEGQQVYEVATISSETLTLTTSGLTNETAQEVEIMELVLDPAPYVPVTPAIRSIVNVNFTDNAPSADTITRASGNWSTDGFAVGQTIVVEGGATSNGGKTFTIASLTATVITLTASDQLLTETGKDVTITVQTPTVNVHFADNGGAADTITRTSGDWLADGFHVGQLLQITGGGTLNGLGEPYEIAHVDATVITLVPAAELVNESNKSVIATAVIPNPALSSIKTARVKLIEDVDITATGDVFVEAGGQVFLGSESTVNIKKVEAGDAISGAEVRIKVSENIFKASASSNPAIRSRDLILEAGAGTIGLAGAEIRINTVNGGILTARAAVDVHLIETTGDLNIGTIFAKSGGAFLQAANGNILDGYKHTFTNIQANVIELTAVGGGIGELDSSSMLTEMLEIDVAQSPSDPVASNATGTITATADQNILLAETTGSMNVRNILSRTGDVNLRTPRYILDAVDLVNPLSPDSAHVSGGPSSRPLADVIGNNITLNAGATSGGLGGIGSTSNNLDIDSGYSGPGVLTASSKLEHIYIIETGADGTPTLDEDLNLFEINAIGENKTAFITAPLGRIRNGKNTGSNSNVLSGKLWVYATGDIGEADKPITTSIGNIEGISTSGSMYICNSGPLKVGGVTDSINGASAGGMQAGTSVLLCATSPVTVTENITSGQQIVVHATDDGNDVTGQEDNVTIKNGIQLITTAPAGDKLAELEEAVLYTVQVDGNLITLLNGGNVIDLGTPPDNNTTTHFITPAGPLNSGTNTQPLGGFESRPFKGSNVSEHANTIDLGSGHGLNNGDQVIYTTAGTISLLAGDDVIMESTSQLTATAAVFLRANFGNTDHTFGGIHIDNATISAGTAIDATASGNIILENVTTATADHDASFNAGRDFIVDNSSITAGDNLTAAVGRILELKNGTSVTAHADATITTVTFTADASSIDAGKNLIASTRSNLLLKDGTTVTAGNDATLTVGTNLNVWFDSSITAGDNLIATVGRVGYLVNGTITAGDDATITAGFNISSSNGSIIEAGKNLVATVTEGVYLRSGTSVTAGDDATITATSHITADASSIDAGKNLIATAGTKFELTDGTSVTAGDDATITASTHFTADASSITAGDNLIATAGTKFELTNGTSVTADDDATITAGSDFTADASSITAVKNLIATVKGNVGLKNGTSLTAGVDASIRAAGNFSQDATSSLVSGDAIRIWGDDPNDDPGGTMIELRGQFNAPLIHVEGASDNDTIVLDPVVTGRPYANIGNGRR